MLVRCTALKIGNTHTGTRMAVGIVAMMHMSAACCSSLMCHQIGRQTEYFRMMMMWENLGNQHQHADCQQKYDLNSLFIIILYHLIISSFFITVIFGYRCGDEYLIDTRSVHIDNLESKSVPLECFTTGRNVLQFLQQQAPNV